MSDFNSIEYWENRYKFGGDSGIGSKGILAEYKTQFINNFVEKNDINSVCELGCGDTLFLQYIIPEFTGYDVSEFIINENRKKSKHIFTTNINELTSYELTISMDVILHLMEEDIYKQYIVDLFRLSSRYVIIYSPNRNQIFSEIHNKFREFMPDVPKNFKLIEHVINPHKGDNTQADFYVFELV